VALDKKVFFVRENLKIKWRFISGVPELQEERKLSQKKPTSFVCVLFLFFVKVCVF